MRLLLRLAAGAEARAGVRTAVSLGELFTELVRDLLRHPCGRVLHDGILGFVRGQVVVDVRRADARIDVELDRAAVRSLHESPRPRERKRRRIFHGTAVGELVLHHVVDREVLEAHGLDGDVPELETLEVVVVRGGVASESGIRREGESADHQSGHANAIHCVISFWDCEVFCFCQNG